ncbi:hypothetical protein EAF00_000804 [Botryotinia globosa]|nr:hypothetical protein EAF00_000804 [Botryotinia globosa]
MKIDDRKKPVGITIGGTDFWFGFMERLFGGRVCYLTRQRPSGFSGDIIPQSNDSHLEIGGIPKQIYGLATPQVVEVDFCTDPLSNYSDLEIEEVLEQIVGSTLAPVGVNSLASPSSNDNDLESEKVGKR